MKISLIKFTITFLSLVIACVCSLVLWIGIYQIDHFQRIFPGVTVWGVDLGGMDKLEAAERLRRRMVFLQKETIILRDRDKSWNFTPGQLGMSVKVDHAIEEAFAVGHSGSLLTDVLEQWDSFYYGHSIAPVIKLDMMMTEELLKGISRDINVLPRDASFSVIGSIFTIDEGQKGRTVDIIENTEKIMEPLSDLVGAEVQLKVDEFTPMQVDVEKERDIGQMIIDTP